MRFKARLPILAALLLASAIGAGVRPAHAGPIVERVVAFVNKKPVLLSDVELTRALLKLDEKEATERAIDEALMFDEASRLVTETLPEEEVARAVLSLREKAGPRFTGPALRRKALVQLAISNYIELRLRPQVRVEDEAVRQVYNERVLNEAQPPPFDLVADAIRESLESRALDQKIEEWVASLRRREDIRRVTPRS
jgi:hypothetical protein